MVLKASENIKNSGRINVKVLIAESDKLPFENESFNIVMARHAPFSTKEIYRVLKKTGIFITQQVGEKDKSNIKKVFGRGRAFEKKASELFEKCCQDLKESGFKIITADQYDTIEYYANMNDIIFLLEHTPIVPEFDKQKDKKYLHELEKKYKKTKGIMTNSARFLIVAKKI
jgi:ubiquinone/menaquinone biosynthesis C-methylase UbiE